MPPGADQDFLNASMEEKIAYLSSVDPAFKSASPQEQGDYIRHLTGQMQPAAGTTSVERTAPPQTFGDKLTAGGSSEGAQAFDVQHPILGKPLRALDAAGGAALGLPGFLYHSIADPLSPEEQVRGQGRLEAIPERLLGGEAGAQAIRDYGAGKVTPGGAASVLPELIGQGVGTIGAVEGLGLAKGGALKIPGVRPTLGKIAGFGANVVDPNVTGIFSPRLASAQRVLGRVSRAMQDKPTIAVERDATLNKRNIPEYAGEEETVPPMSPTAVIPRIGGRSGGPMPRPFLPAIATPEQIQIFKNQMGILKPEAQAAGMYSAARGAVRGLGPDYQMRIGGKLRPYGPPENLMEEEIETPRPKKVENE